MDLFHHSIETVRQIQAIYEKSAPEVKEHLEKIDFGGFSRLAHLKLAGFMHDIGKFSCWFIEEDTGRHRFYKHENEGEKLCVPVLKKLKFSNKQIDYIKKIIKNHMYATAVVCSPELTPKVMMRYIRKMEDDSLDAIIIAKADRETIEPLPKLLDGNEIMKILKIPPSPLLGKILSDLHEAQINGDVNTKEEAIEFIKKEGK